MRNISLLVITVAIAALLSACGSDAPPATTSTVPVATGYLDAPQADRVVGNTFRAALSRLAVMSQPGDDASDLGQQLPTGTVDAVRCGPAGPRPASGTWRWRCLVRWQTVDGQRESTRYTTELTDRGCVYANARPGLRQIRDATTHAPAEHPLNVLAGAIKGC